MKVQKIVAITLALSLVVSSLDVGTIFAQEAKRLTIALVYNVVSIVPL